MTDNNMDHNWLKLIDKFIDNACTREELDQLFRKFEQENDKEQLSDVLRTYWAKARYKKDHLKVDWDSNFESMMMEAKSQAPVLPMRRFSKKPALGSWAAAAGILLLLSVGSYWMFDKNAPEEISKKEPVSKKIPNDAAPGRNTAVLTLADGSTIILDSVQNGPLTRQGNSKIIKIGSGQLSYNNLSKNPTEVVYNTISTPRGGQYEIKLADGSKVWLNAASSLRFPTAFIGSERNVVLTGEGYFEVAKNAKKPFNVIVNGMRVDVLGTHFNVNAYSDESEVATTLLEGSVRITNYASAKLKSNTVIIKPGQQAKLSRNGEMNIVDDVDLEQSIAWKNGQFQFNNLDIAAIIRQLSRWYDVDVHYQGSIPKRFFTGKISRNSNASQVIQMLEYAKVNLRIEGKNIIVMP